MAQIGIRREDKSIWERRVPVIPRDVRKLRRHHGVQIIVQPSESRIFTDEEFALAGATVQEDLAGCPIIFAVKEIPPELLLPQKTYILFAHVAKGQPHNMPMLRRLLELSCTLIDYEKVVDDQGRRLIFFGRHAGWAGMVDTLWAFGRRLKAEGIPNPFQALHPMHTYERLARAKTALEVVGEWIRVEGLPEAVSPLIVGVAGYGNVSVGAQEMLSPMPLTDIEPSDLARVASDGAYSRHTVYKTVFKEHHTVEPLLRGQPFDLQEYYNHPDRYHGVFARYLPHLSILVNAIYWTPRYPRLVTKDALRDLFAGESSPRLKVIGDITCDIGGAIEATVRSTDPGSPVYVFDPASEQTSDGVEGSGPVIMAVDILPSELPREASADFSHALLDYIPAIAATDFGAGLDELQLPPPVRRAVIAHRGELTPDYRFLAQHLGL
jgi:saccharopine dehydrogenase (NAD+, L-lysine-forming)